MDTVAKQGPFKSVYALSKALRRDRAAVGRDVKALVSAGLKRLDVTWARKTPHLET
jgi:predicted transcriptional regulator